MMFSMLISIYEYYIYNYNNMILGLRDCDYNYSYSRFGGYRLRLGLLGLAGMRMRQ